MKRPSRRAIVIAAVSAGTVAVLVAGAIVGLTVKADTEARAAYDEAISSLKAAHSSLDTAQRDHVTAQQNAAWRVQSGTDLAAIADPTLMPDTAALDALQAKTAELTTLAQLVEADDALVAPEPPKQQAHPSPTMPADRAALLAQTADLKSETAELKAEAAALTAQTADITKAASEVDAAAAAVAASAHAFGIAAVPPARASAESVAAFTAAVAALEAPAAGADLTALVLAYRDSWYATVASDAGARASSGAGSETYIRGVLIVNKTYALPSTFGSGLTTETSNAFAAMQADAAELGLNIYIASGFRSFASQTSIYNRYMANEGQAGADRHSARPGHSEHQSGLAFDLNSITEAFGSTAEGIWVRDNAHLYGFIVRYPPGKESITGYVWEPWHLRHVGTDVAAKLFSSGQTLEEYLGVTSVYS